MRRRKIILQIINQNKTELYITKPKMQFIVRKIENSKRGTVSLPGAFGGKMGPEQENRQQGT